MLHNEENSMSFDLQAQVRADQGKGASRRLRRLDNQVPAIVYGGEQAPQNISVSQKDLLKLLDNPAFFSAVINLNVDGTAQPVLLRDLQRHPAQIRLLHADFQRLSGSEVVRVRVALKYINQESCVGVKTQGGKLSINLKEIDVLAPANAIPENIVVDMAQVNAGTVLHISDVALPEGVKSVDLNKGSKYNHAIATISAPRGGQ